jgi:hypothetical protein
MILLISRKYAGWFKKIIPRIFLVKIGISWSLNFPTLQLDVCNHSELKSLSSLADFTVGLVKTVKATTYSMVDRLLRLVITLSVSAATTERAFSAMKLIKTRLPNRMRDDFLRHYMIVYIGKDIVAKICSDEIRHRWS